MEIDLSPFPAPAFVSAEREFGESIYYRDSLEEDFDDESLRRCSPGVDYPHNEYPSHLLAINHDHSVSDSNHTYFQASSDEQKSYPKNHRKVFSQQDFPIKRDHSESMQSIENRVRKEQQSDDSQSKKQTHPQPQHAQQYQQRRNTFDQQLNSELLRMSQEQSNNIQCDESQFDHYFQSHRNTNETHEDYFQQIPSQKDSLESNSNHHKPKKSLALDNFNASDFEEDLIQSIDLLEGLGNNKVAFRKVVASGQDGDSGGGFKQDLFSVSLSNKESYRRVGSPIVSTSNLANFPGSLESDYKPDQEVSTLHLKVQEEEENLTKQTNVVYIHQSWNHAEERQKDNALINSNLLVSKTKKIEVKLKDEQKQLGRYNTDVLQPNDIQKQQPLNESSLSSPSNNKDIMNVNGLNFQQADDLSDYLTNRSGLSNEAHCVNQSLHQHVSALMRDIRVNEGSRGGAPWQTNLSQLKRSLHIEPKTKHEGSLSSQNDQLTVTPEKMPSTSNVYHQTAEEKTKELFEYSNSSTKYVLAAAQDLIGSYQSRPTKEYYDSTLKNRLKVDLFKNLTASNWNSNQNEVPSHVFLPRESFQYQQQDFLQQDSHLSQPQIFNSSSKKPMSLAYRTDINEHNTANKLSDSFNKADQSRIDTRNQQGEDSGEYEDESPRSNNQSNNLHKYPLYKLNPMKGVDIRKYNQDIMSMISNNLRKDRKKHTLCLIEPAKSSTEIIPQGYTPSKQSIVNQSNQTELSIRVKKAQEDEQLHNLQLDCLSQSKGAAEVEQNKRLLKQSSVIRSITRFNLQEVERFCVELIVSQQFEEAAEQLEVAEEFIMKTFKSPHSQITYLAFLNASVQKGLERPETSLRYCERGLKEIQQRDLYQDKWTFSIVFSMRQMAACESKKLLKHAQVRFYLEQMLDQLAVGCLHREDTSEQVALAAIELKAKHSQEIHKELARAMTETKQFSLAASHFQAAISHSTETNIEVLLEYSQVLVQDGHIEEGKNQLKIIVKTLRGQRDSLQLLISTLDSLGQLCFDSASYLESSEWYEQSLSIKQSYFGSNHVTTSIGRFLVGKSLQKAKEFHRAIVKFTQCMSLLDASLGPANIYSANSLLCMAEISRSTQKLDESLRYYQLALPRFSSILGSSHFNCLCIALNLLFLALSAPEPSNHIVQLCFYEITANTKNSANIQNVQVLNEMSNMLRNAQLIHQALEGYYSARNLQDFLLKGQQSEKDKAYLIQQRFFVTLNISSTLVKLNRMKEAIAEYEGMLQANCRLEYQVRILHQIGLIYLRLKNFPRAGFYFAQALNLLALKDGFAEEKQELQAQIKQCLQSQ